MLPAGSGTLNPTTFSFIFLINPATLDYRHAIWMFITIMLLMPEKRHFNKTAPHEEINRFTCKIILVFFLITGRIIYSLHFSYSDC